MTFRQTLTLAAALPLFALAACGSSDEAENAAEQDPALAGALEDQIMVDPDLAGQNNGNAALGADRMGGALPPLDMSPEAVSAAQQEAYQMVGGQSAMKQAPDAGTSTTTQDANGALMAAAQATSTSPSGADCASGAREAMDWAAKMPGEFPVYPRANVQEAAGNDADGCGLRVVSFRTPVPLEEVMAFYYTRAAGAGFDASRVQQGGDDILAGRKGARSYVLYARSLPSGATEAELIVNAA